MKTDLQYCPQEVLNALPSPCYALELEALKRNMEILQHVREKSGAKILLALKGFAMFSVFPYIRPYLDGICASGLNEAILGYEEFQKEVHTYSPAYKEHDLQEIVKISNHVIFNSFREWKKHESIRNANPQIEYGLRVNPEYSEAEVDLYNPCGQNSRLGIRACDFENQSLVGVSGLHFHAHCQQNADALQRTLQVFDQRFESIIKNHPMKWLNWGGGHHITRPDYDVNLLIDLVKRYHDKYQAQIYLEPGEAVGLNTGVLIATVMDIVQNANPIAVLDLSVSCHMPDVLEMPYRPEIIGAGAPNEKEYTYLLAGNSCLAGDQCGFFSFDKPLEIGQKLVFLDMAHYTMVKTTFFNGVHHPSIAYYSSETGKIEIAKDFTYADYKSKLS